jgi:molybdopterin-containing oxidoreductase family membrane subunit
MEKQDYFTFDKEHQDINENVNIESIHEDLLKPVQNIPGSGKIWIVFLLIVCIAGAYAYSLQLKNGLVVTNMENYVSWGIYISSFVFFVAVSLVGALISSILRLLNFKWSEPITRIAEIIAVASIICAAVIIIVDMGRPDRILYLFAHGRLQSPIIWDITVVISYLITSILFLYISLLPSIALCRDKLKNKPAWQMRFYRVASLGWHGSSSQVRRMKKSIKVISILIIPLAVSIHTVTAWLFATTLRPGWNSTGFGPYFVAGAFLAGTGAVVIVMAVFRWFYHLEKYITNLHFDYMGKLLVFLGIVYFYFNVNEFLIPTYSSRRYEAQFLSNLFTGKSAYLFWFTQLAGMILPVCLLLFRRMRRPVPLTIVAFFILIGAWFKRYLIVVPVMLNPYLPVQDVPKSWSVYFPSLVEIAIVAGLIAAGILFITLFSRLFPVISVEDIAGGRGNITGQQTGQKNFGKDY